MGREFMKPLTFEEYLYFYRETLAKDLNTKQLKEILSMHGFQKLSNHHKDEIFSMVRCLHLISPTRSTIHGGNAQLISTGAKSAPSVEELKKDIRDTEWQECPVGSIETVDPAALAVAGGMGDNLSSVTSNFSVPRGPDKNKGGVIRKRSRRNNLKKQEATMIICVASSNLNNIDDHRWTNKGTSILKGYPFPRLVIFSVISNQLNLTFKK
ncbi:hypothetical protein LUZ62_039018 [Rhynchospora pubera]|uniref:DUF7787 domain-containing protein n=1 Tax=Rhynchospora pubera TaxID=906938 RepID=A0AAV8FC45_9POAL|nr:hypothetical protein LUZ62_039018 [Rhynchospora pubera]